MLSECFAVLQGAAICAVAAAAAAAEVAAHVAAGHQSHFEPVCQQSCHPDGVAYAVVRGGFAAMLAAGLDAQHTAGSIRSNSLKCADRPDEPGGAAPVLGSWQLQLAQPGHKLWQHPMVQPF